jgi:autotransporter-associated beta strand protein
MKSKNKTVQHLGFIALAFAGFASTIAHAATDTWQGTVGSTDWATNGNWTYSTGSAIATGDSLVFTSANASASTTLTNTLATSFNVASMTYNSGALAYTMTGNAFNLTGSITNNSTSLQTINNAITLSNAAHTFTTTNANGGLALGGGFSGTTIQNVTFVGPGTITLGGTNTFNTKNGNFNALIVGGSVSGGASTGGNVSITGATTVDGTGFSDSRGFIDIHGNSTLTVQTGGSLTINGSSNASAQTQIGQNATGTSTLRVNGGSLTVSGAQGFLLGNNRADATGVLQISSGTATITAGNTTRGDARNQITLGRSAGNGRIDLDGGTLETGRYFIRGGAGTANFNFNGGTLKALANQTAGTGWFETATTITTTVKAGGAKIDTNGFDTNINTVLAHDSGLGGTADGGLTKSGTGTLTLAAANTYTGATKVSAGTLIADTATNATVLSASSNLVMAGGTFQLKGLALTDRTQTLNGLNVSLGASVVDANNLGTSTTLDLRGSGGSQVISRGSHATVDFKATTGTLGTTALIQAGTTNTNGLIGGWATVNGGTDFASNSTDTSSGYVVAATSSGGDLGDSGLASDSTLNFKPSGTQTDLTSAKAFNSLNFSDRPEPP